MYNINKKTNRKEICRINNEKNLKKINKNKTKNYLSTKKHL